MCGSTASPSAAASSGMTGKLVTRGHGPDSGGAACPSDSHATVTAVVEQELVGAVKAARDRDMLEPVHRPGVTGPQGLRGSAALQEGLAQILGVLSALPLPLAQSQEQRA